jgi:hypothetical protein
VHTFVLTVTEIVYAANHVAAPAAFIAAIVVFWVAILVVAFRH